MIVCGTIDKMFIRSSNSGRNMHPIRSDYFVAIGCWILHQTEPRFCDLGTICDLGKECPCPWLYRGPGLPCHSRNKYNTENRNPKTKHDKTANRTPRFDFFFLSSSSLGSSSFSVPCSLSGIITEETVRVDDFYRRRLPPEGADQVPPFLVLVPEGRCLAGVGTELGGGVPGEHQRGVKRIGALLHREQAARVGGFGFFAHVP